jgi:hypothetical protein
VQTETPSEARLPCTTAVPWDSHARGVLQIDPVALPAQGPLAHRPLIWGEHDEDLPALNFLFMAALLFLIDLSLRSEARAFPAGNHVRFKIGLAPFPVRRHRTRRTASARGVNGLHPHEEPSEARGRGLCPRRTRCEPRAHVLRALTGARARRGRPRGHKTRHYSCGTRAVGAFRHAGYVGRGQPSCQTTRRSPTRWVCSRRPMARRGGRPGIGCGAYSSLR